MFSYLLCLLLIPSSIAQQSGGDASGCKYAGVNIAGFDFGCITDGTCTLGSVSPPLGGGSGQGDGAAQMQHFVTQDKFNVFRLPVGWQYLVDSPGGTLNQNFATYDKLVQACIAAKANCIIDIHNYARWNGAIIGQGGPSNEDFAGLWGQIAKKYAASSAVWYGLVNEPHEVPDMGAWAKTCQDAVNAIRQSGGTGKILLPGNVYTAAGAFVSSGSAAALATVTDPSGGTENLIFDFHNYFDSDNSGTHADCTTNKITDGFTPPLDFLRQNKRQALVSELGGGGSSASCLTMICEALDFLNTNSDVYLGWVAWAAGSFPNDYVLQVEQGGQDTQLMSQCFAGKFGGGPAGGGGGITAVGGGAVGGSTNGTESPGAGAGGAGGGTTQPLSFLQTGSSSGSGNVTDTGAGGGTGTGTGAGAATSGGAQSKCNGKRRRKRHVAAGQNIKRGGKARIHLQEGKLV
ncbi:uncharacterized protein KY384_000907 [Bacidia gigantensis]|uniref:uncharacterized protein n=1 Tax=Bacidia gigantensis TaxID=2732470 RepID=UPI001D03E8C9|nr:uncharacterized protein KY384_000907 [Bacidia gigantensis]KAG8534064.1 hypothetical protein KY384_000907 [Bacidia gigantensis]